ncbi:MAG: hypothetical protein KC910_10440 [Candidatus Eremiobacteraeota bacterium]|nr:hypothetical protein [Candidatus Eremiobacteraeota bacterium]
MRRGLSLAEVVFAAAVAFLIGILVLNLFPTSLLAISRTQARLVANNLAQDRLARLRHTNFSQVDVGLYQEDLTVEGQSYQLRREVYQVSGRDPNLLKGARVTVSWNVRGKPQQVLAETYLSGVRH